MSIRNILERYDNNLEKYYKETIPILDQYVENSRQPYNKLLKGIFDFYVFSSYLLDNDVIFKNVTSDTIKGLYVKGSLNLFSIYSCLFNGLASEAATLIRSLFETLLTLKLLLITNTEERIKLYDNFKIVQRMNSINSNKKLLELGIIDINRFQKTYPNELVEETNNKYENIKKDYHPRLPYHWAWKIFKDTLSNRNPSIFYIAKHLGFHFDYVKIYSTMSISVHSSPLLENIIGDGKTQTLAPVFSKHIERLSFLSLDYMGKIILEILSKYSDESTHYEIDNYIHAYFVGLLESWENA